MTSSELAFKRLQSWAISESDMWVYLTSDRSSGPPSCRFDFVGKAAIEANDKDFRLTAKDTKSGTTLAISLDAAARVEVAEHPESVRVVFRCGADLFLGTSPTALPVV